MGGLSERLSSSHPGQRNKLILWGCVLTLLMVLSPAGAKTESPPSHISVVSRATRAVILSTCKDTLYQEACLSALLSSTTNLLQKTPVELFDLSVQYSMARAQSARELAYNLSQSNQKVRTHEFDAMDDCIELLEDSLDQLSNVLNRNKSLVSFFLHVDHDVQTWLSAALTNQETCSESLKNYKFEVEKGIIDGKAQNLSQFISNSLVLYKSAKTVMLEAKKGINPGGSRRRLLSDDFPGWLSSPERKLLESSLEEIEVSAVVAKDGTGTHMTISEALASSLAGDSRTVIHIKAGTYKENLKISAQDVMLVGDGKGVTVIVGNRNSEDGWTTFQSATVAATGSGFIARDITFVNSAGPAKHQAVALRVGSDKSVIYRCSIIAYQDTLYTHTQRQFYRETDIYGTVDFIFGNSAVVFQNCNIYPRKPLSGQKNFITAQGRTDPNQNTGISIHNCKITASSDLAPVRSHVQTFLGRPWMKYSRTVIMQSFLDESIHPLGWAPWGSSAPQSLYYGEYMNSGPGATTSGRVKWAGYHAALTTAEAETFTVAGFISGNIWLPSTGVSFDSGLIA